MCLYSASLNVGAAVGAAATLPFAAAVGWGWRGALAGWLLLALAALALWLPWQAVLALLVIMSFAGGVLTIATVIHHRMKKAGGTPEIPYGVAIAFAGIWLIGQRFLNQFG